MYQEIFGKGILTVCYALLKAAYATRQSWMRQNKVVMILLNRRIISAKMIKAIIWCLKDIISFFN